MPNKGPIFQDHHTIEQQTLKNSRLLRKLSDADLFEMHAVENRIFLPADPKLAHDIGITPHSGGPIGDYQFGVRTFLEDLERTTYGRAALAGDPEALKRVAARVELFRDTMKAGLINGDLNTNAPLGMSADDIRPKVQSFFGNPQSYSQTYVQQIDGFKSLSNTELNWSPIAHSETRLLSTLQYMGQTSNNLTKGGDPDIGRQSLTQAVTQAHASGRLTLSEQGILQFEQTFGEEVASPLRVPRSQRGFISPELLYGDFSLNQGARVLGTLATGIDGYQTAKQANEFLSQDNATAANEQWARFGARNAIGWGGGTIAAAAGVTGAGPWALVAADLYLLTEAADRGISHWQNRKIYTQEDRDEKGVTWEFEGKDWIRKDLRVDRLDDGEHDPQPARYSARPEKAQKLSYQAGAEAAEQALGNVPTPRNPFVQPVSDSDLAHLHTMRWTYNVDSERWSRMVSDTVDREGAPEWNADPEYASPDRTTQLNAQAVQTIDENLMAGPAAIAMRYHFCHKAYGYGEVGDVPAAVTSAMTTDRLRASDDRYYERDVQGTWTRGGESASPPRALELDLTRERLLAAMPKYDEELARIPEWKPLTREQADRAELRGLYISNRRNPDVRPEEFEAAYAAVQRTRSEHGIGRENTALELGPMAAGQSIIDIGIRHTRREGADGKDVQPIAITTPNDIAAVLRERQSLGHEDHSPSHGPPEQKITQATPEQRDAREQVQREANRQGLSRDEASEALQAVRSTVAIRDISWNAANPEVDDAAQGQRRSAQEVPATQTVPHAAAVVAMAQDARADDAERAKREPTGPDRTAGNADAVRDERDAVTAPSTVTPAAHDPDALHPGDRNSQVELLQYRLDRQGYRRPDNQPIPQDGHYGPDTEHAVRQFQQDRDLPVTGTADLATQYAAAQTRSARVESSDIAGHDLTKTIAPTPETSSLTIERAGVSERDAVANFAREANWQGLSEVDMTEAVQQARVEHAAPVPDVSMRGGSATQVRPDQDDQAHDQDARTRTSQEPSVPSSEVPAMAAGHRAVSVEREEEDRAQRERGEPSSEAAASRETSPEITAAAPMHPSFDPRHPDHPDHRAMYLNAREKIADLYERNGIPMPEEKLERATAAVLSDARAERMTKIAAVEFTASEKYGNVPNVDGKIVAWTHDPVERVPWSKASLTDTQTLDQHDPDRDYARFREETIKEQQSLAEFQKQQEEINRNPTGPVMTMGSRTLSPAIADGPSGSDGGGGDGGGG